MEIKIHQIGNVKIAEIISENVIMATVDDGLDLVGNVYYQDFDRIIIHEKAITNDFFDLKTGIAGEILQKFSTYRVRLAIVGDFSRYQSKSLKDFIFESNKSRQINFCQSVADAVANLSAY
ncbi:DUF4180 domain-containing protein [Spirosoma harenae]